MQALEATERMIPNNTRHRFRVSDERVARFSVGEVVLFKDPENVPAKTKKDAKDPFQVRNVLGVVKERSDELRKWFIKMSHHCRLAKRRCCYL